MACLIQGLYWMEIQLSIKTICGALGEAVNSKNRLNKQEREYTDHVPAATSVCLCLCIYFFFLS